MEILLEKAIFNRIIYMPVMNEVRLFEGFVSMYILKVHTYIV